MSQVERLGMVQLLLLGDLPPKRHNPFNCIDPLFNGIPDETTWSLLDRICMPMLPNDNTISVRTDPRSSYRPSGHNPNSEIPRIVQSGYMTNDISQQDPL